MKKLVAVVGLALALTGCAATTEAVEETPKPAKTTSPTPTPSSDPSNGVPFGQAIETAGWEVRIDQPRDVTADVAKEYEGTGLEAPLEPGMTYIGVPGSVTRTGDGPADPYSELSVAVVVNNQVIDPDGQSLTSPPALMDVGELFPDGEAEFIEIFMLPEGTTVPTVAVYAGMGEDTQQTFWGEAVELDTESASPDVDTMKTIWEQATPEQQAESFQSWGLANGVTEQGIQTLISEGEGAGVILDENEARTFLEWVLTQQ